MSNRQLLILLFLPFFLAVSRSNDDIILKMSPPKKGTFYEFGESLNLTCKIRNLKSGEKVFFENNNDVRSEDIETYIDGVKITKLVDGQYTTFLYQKSKLNWKDNGTWACTYGRMVKKRLINVKVIKLSTAGPISVELLKSPKKVNDNVPKYVLGKGTRTNPHDLLNGAKIKISTVSTCGNFKQIYKWSYYNISEPDNVIQLKEVKTVAKKCTLLNGGPNGVITTSSIEVTCKGPPELMGSSRITVTSSFKEIESTEEKSVYVLCPGGHRNVNGPNLTNMEIIGICVSILVTLSMIVCLTMSARRLIRKAHDEKYGEIGNSAHIQAIRV